MKPKNVSKRLLLNKTTVAHLRENEMLAVKAGKAVAHCTIDITCWTRLDSSCEH